MFYNVDPRFEKFGSDNKRTILNKLVSSICFCSIVYFGILQPMEKMRYIFGRLPAWMCGLHFVVYNSIVVQFLLLCDAISIFRSVNALKVTKVKAVSRTPTTEAVFSKSPCRPLPRRSSVEGYLFIKIIATD